VIYAASKLSRLAAIALLVGALFVASAEAKSYDVGTEELNEFKQAEIISSPQPAIPSQVQEEGCSASCVARFSIEPNGKVQVKLLTSSGSDEIDDITLNTLRRWKFKPAMLDGKPVASTRRVKVEFEIN
jgi:TonB family protein